MKTSNIYLIAMAIVVLSCQQPPSKKEENHQALKKEAHPKENSLLGKPIFSAEKVTESFVVFWDYYTTNIELFKDFKALDTTGNEITRVGFLKKLTTGKYFPLKLYAENNNITYKLEVLPVKADENIEAYMKRFADEQLAFCKLESKLAPKFDFTAIDGKHYTSANTKGKIVLFKCWYISCVACVKEMPALNKIVAKYKDRDDILFISLAMDQRKDLQKFLTTTKFDYETVANQTKYMSDQLHVSAYPTHFIINKKGEIVRMLPDETAVEEAIEIELAK